MTAMTLRPDHEIVQYLADEIGGRLDAGQKVLWLIPGGSASVVAIEVMQRLEQSKLANLYITLTDERYGPLGHPNENWTQLVNAGFETGAAQTYRVLTGEAPECTTDHFDQKLQEWLPQVDFAIGLFGVGADGHTAGIKPHSPAVESDERAAYFVGEDFERITITPNAIRDIDEAVVYACGTAKFPVLQSLIEESLPLDEQPAQALKLAGSTMLFSDYYDKVKGVST